jgi:hypothetical protein
MLFPKQLVALRKKTRPYSTDVGRQDRLHVTQIKRYEAGAVQSTLEVFPLASDLEGQVLRCVFRTLTLLNRCNISLANGALAAGLI